MKEFQKISYEGELTGQECLELLKNIKHCRSTDAEKILTSQVREER